VGLPTGGLPDRFDAGAGRVAVADAAPHPAGASQSPILTAVQRSPRSRGDRHPPGDARGVRWPRRAVRVERHDPGCWCMVFCSRRADWSARWHTGDNRSAFETMARGSAHPMGVLAYDGTQPVGWCAAGPRSHYTTATSNRSRVMRGRDPAEDDTVWLVACFFVRVGWRNAGISRRLLDAAVGLGRRSGARAVEAGPDRGETGDSPTSTTGARRCSPAPASRCRSDRVRNEP